MRFQIVKSYRISKAISILPVHSLRRNHAYDKFVRYCNPKSLANLGRWLHYLQFWYGFCQYFFKWVRFHGQKSDKSPIWKAHGLSASKEIPQTLGNLKGQYPVHVSLTFVPVLNHIKPLHVLPTYFVRLILILSYNPHMGLPCGLFTSGFSSKSLYTFLF